MTDLHVGSIPLMQAVLDTNIVWERELIKPGLVQHYDAINNTGSGHNSSATTWKDLVGTNDGTLQLGVNWLPNSLNFTAGRVQFNGALTTSFTLMSTMSIEKTGTHPRWTADPQYPTIYHHTNAGAQNMYAFGWYSLAGGGLTTYDDTFNARPQAVLPPDNEIYHIAVRYDENTRIAELFLNGTKVAQTTRPVWSGQSVVTAYLGGNATTTRFMTGTISDYLRYDRPLEDWEIHHNSLVSLKRFT